MARRGEGRQAQAGRRVRERIGSLASRGVGTQGLYNWMRRQASNSARRRSAGGAGG